jgi:hypothetical protein
MMEAIDDRLRDPAIVPDCEQVWMAQVMISPVAGSFMLRRYENGIGRTKNLVVVGGFTEVEHVKQVFAGSVDVSHEYLPGMSTQQEQMLEC